MRALGYCLLEIFINLARVLSVIVGTKLGSFRQADAPVTLLAVFERNDLQVHLHENSSSLTLKGKGSPTYTKLYLKTCTLH